MSKVLAIEGRDSLWSFMSVVHRLGVGLAQLLRRPFRQPTEARGSTSRSRVLLIACADGTQIDRALALVRLRYPDHGISLAVSHGLEARFHGRRDLDGTYAYDTHPGTLWRETRRLRRDMRDRCDLVMVLRQSTISPAHVNCGILLSLCVKAGARLTLVPDRDPVPLGRAAPVAAMADLIGFALGVWMARLGTLAVLWVTGWIGDRGPESPRRSRSRECLAILVPILPDLSHTFIYREVLDVLRQAMGHKRVIVIALEEGSYAPLHPEARLLLAHAIFVPFDSLTRYVGAYLHYLFTRPRRLARLIRAYAGESNGDPWMFLRLANFHALHPARSILLARELESDQATYVHCYGTSYSSTRAMTVSRLLGIPFSISTFADFDDPYPFKSLVDKVREARFAVVCTRFCKGRLLELTDGRYRSKIHVIHHGLPVQYGSSADSEPKHWPGSSPVGVFAACRLVPKKGLDVLIRAAALLRSRSRAIRCLIIGSGGELASLQHLVNELDLSEHVQFAGTLANDEIWNFVGPEDICVAPSVYCEDGDRDGIPVILMEALLHGHAVVTTPVSGIPELVADRVHGLLVPERDADALADAIERLVKDDGLRRQLAQAGGRRVRAEFDIAKKATRLRELIDGASDDDTSQQPHPRVADVAAARAASSPGRVSVVIVNHNGLRFVEPLFESLSKQRYEPEDVWCFDNGSSDGSVDRIRAQYPRVSIVTMGRNTGYSVPVNEGIRRSSGEYVLVLNMDVVLDPACIEELVSALESHPTVGWVAPKILKLRESGPSQDIDCLGHHMSRSRYATETDHSRPFSWAEYGQQQFVFGASACVALYRRRMLQDVAQEGEYFDEDFFAYFEDVDLDWRAQHRGWKCLYAPDALAYHVRGGSGLIRRPEIAAGYLANRWLMLVKNDQMWHFLRDVRPFAGRLIRDLYFYGRTNPRALPIAAWRFGRLLPKMAQKRRRIQASRVTPLRYVRRLIR